MSVNVFARPNLPVVISGAFIIFLRHTHFITEFFFKKKSGEAKDSVIFPFFVLLHKRAKPMLPPCNHFSYPNLFPTFTNHPSNHALLRITSVLPYITIRYYTLLVTYSNREMTRRKGCCLVWDIYGTYDI